MSTKSPRNFHLPLPDDLYSKLMHLSKSSAQPATVLARKALRFWFEQLEKEELDRHIREYACSVSGTECDLDEELESSAMEFLLETDNAQ
jgi:hypothetical protein